MSTPDHDLHDESLARLYRQLPAAEPSAATDAAILAAARAAVAAPASRWRRYRAPFALAATVVLAVTVLLRTETPEQAALPAAVESAARDIAASDAPVEEPRMPAPVTSPAGTRARQAAPVTMAGEPAPAYAPSPAAAEPEAEAMSMEDHAPAVAAGSAPMTDAAADRLAPASSALNAAPAPQRKVEALAERAPMEFSKSRTAVTIAWPFAIGPGSDPDDACARLARATPSLACTRDDGRVHVAFDGLPGSGLFAGATLVALEMNTDGSALRYTARSTDGTLPARLLAQLAAEGWVTQAGTTDTVRRTIGNRAWQVRVNGDGEVVSLVAMVVP